MLCMHPNLPHSLSETTCVQVSRMFYNTTTCQARYSEFIHRCSFPHHFFFFPSFGMKLTCTPASTKYVTRCSCICDNSFSICNVFHLQFGFRENTSAHDAIQALLCEINKSLVESNPCPCLFIDLCKGYDTVSHSLLLQILESIGIGRNSLKLLGIFLSGRNQLVRVSGVISVEKIVEFGVPQGTVVGAILFNVCINELLVWSHMGIFWALQTTQHYFMKPPIEPMADRNEYGERKYLPFSCNAACLPLFDHLAFAQNGTSYEIYSVNNYK